MSSISQAVLSISTKLSPLERTFLDKIHSDNEKVTILSNQLKKKVKKKEDQVDELKEENARLLEDIQNSRAIAEDIIAKTSQDFGPWKKIVYTPYNYTSLTHILKHAKYRVGKFGSRYNAKAWENHEFQEKVAELEKELTVVKSKISENEEAKNFKKTNNQLKNEIQKLEIGTNAKTDLIQQLEAELKTKDKKLLNLEGELLQADTSTELILARKSKKLQGIYIRELKDKDKIISKLAHYLDVQKAETEKLQRAICLNKISVENDKSSQYIALRDDFKNSWSSIQKLLRLECNLNANENYRKKLNEFYLHMSSKLYGSSGDSS